MALPCKCVKLEEFVSESFRMGRVVFAATPLSPSRPTTLVRPENRSLKDACRCIGEVAEVGVGGSSRGNGFSC